MRFFSPNEIQHALAHGPHGISGIKNMQNNIRRVDDLVQLCEYSTGGTLGEDGFDVFVMRLFVGFRVVDDWNQE